MKRLVALAFGLLAAACGNDSPPLSAENLDVFRPVPDAVMAAAYLDLVNRSDRPIRITRITSPQFESVEIHETSYDGGVARMRPVDAVTVQPGETLVLARGGLHLMLMQPAGGGPAVTLNFFSGEDLVLSVSSGPD